MAFDNLRFTESAERDLDGILSYISAELCNPGAAASFYSELEDELRRICDFPNSGSPVQNDFLKARDIRKKFIGNYTLYYRQNEDGVIIILRIVSSRRNQDAIEYMC